MVEIVVEFLGYLVFVLLRTLFHVTGRGLIFLLTLGYARMSWDDAGDWDGSWLDFGATVLGFLFWLAAIALTLYLLLA